MLHPFPLLTLSIFVAGYITARWDLVTRLHELAIFAWDYGVVTRTAKGFTLLSLCFFILILPVVRIAVSESNKLSILDRLAPVYLQENNCEEEARFDQDQHGDMFTQDGLVRIFWPTETIKQGTPGVLVGWRNSESDITIASILTDTEETVIENALRVGTLFRNSPHPLDRLLSSCGDVPLEIVGLLNAPAESNGLKEPLFKGFSEGDPIREPIAPKRLFKAYSSKDPKQPHITFKGQPNIGVQIIYYSRPDPNHMQYTSLQSMSLALSDKRDKVAGPEVTLDDVDAAEIAEAQRVAVLVEKMKLHTVARHKPTAKELVLPTIINQMNCSFELNTLIQRNLNRIRTRRRRTLSVSERVVESATNLWDYIGQLLWYVYNEVLYPLATQIFILGLVLHRAMAEIVVILAEWRLRPQDAAIKDVSAIAQQVDLRLQQFCYWPIQYITLRERRQDWASLATNQAEYIRFYNSLWLVANDVIMGIAVGSFIVDNADTVADQINMLLTDWSLEGLRRMISWLMVYPAGLKLNTELARFLGDLFLWVIDYWAGCVATVQPTFPHLIRFIGFASFAGATMPLSLCSDMVSVLTLHVHCFYIASARMYSWQLTILISLFHLFRGKKRNVLRNRIDSCDYELDQLLLGTILFTVLSFLLPTVLVFYLTFALARMGIIIFKAILDTLLAALNHFPLFALMLRIKDSRRLPGGVRFELQHVSYENNKNHDGVPASYIALESTPLSIQAIFHEYFQFGNRLRKHYLSPSVVLCLATGGFVPPLHRRNLYGLQYSMLPARRVGIVELWRRLSDHWPPFFPSSGMEEIKQTYNGHSHSR